jgi:exoribonuclease-2
MNTHKLKHREILERIAYRAMLDKGLFPDFSAAVLTELDTLEKQVPKRVYEIGAGKEIRDYRSYLWASIDNDDSHDLDQLTTAEDLQNGLVKIFVAVADVDSLVKMNTAIDDHAKSNTTTVYTVAKIFPMLPEKLSTNLTSLNMNEDRLAIVIEMVINPDGSLNSSDIYQALVRNKAQLAYNSVAAWLDGTSSIPAELSRVDGLPENITIQWKAAHQLKRMRHMHGALSLETIEAKPLIVGDQVLSLDVEEKNSAKEIIEDFMIAANGVVARYLDSKKFPSIRRVVRTPKRWDRIVEVANEHGFRLPDAPDSKALELFLHKQKEADPIRFPDLSLVVIKLLGAGEYVADIPGETPPGHFGLAVKDYTHSTAPNRRFTDLVTHRLVKAALKEDHFPYDVAELGALARHCTEVENIVNKIERQVGKSAAALLLESRIGERFDAIVTGAAPKGTWVRLINLPVEGKLIKGYENLDVGHKLQVQLAFIDVDRGYIDFRKL